jgi:hypothetical protein
MPESPNTEVITADSSAEQARKSSPIFKKLMRARHSASMHHDDNMREDDYKGHHIMVMTTYQVKIDGKVFEGELAVTNDGHVHYHGIPNIGFTSALDLVKTVIDAFPDEFPAKGGSGGMATRTPAPARKKAAKKTPRAKTSGD